MWKDSSPRGSPSTNEIRSRGCFSTSTAGARSQRRLRYWQFEHVLVLSDLDREILLKERPELADRISVWPVPVRPHPAIQTDEGHPFTVLILGSLRSIGRVHGLRWLVDEVWPKVRARVNDARLEVVGADPPADIRSRHGRDGISIHGFVEDLEPILARTDVCAIPLFIGAGIRIKVLEMVSRSIPCLGSPVALQGLDWLESSQMVDTPTEWIDALVATAANLESLRAQARRDAMRLPPVTAPRWPPRISRTSCGLWRPERTAKRRRL